MEYDQLFPYGLVFVQPDSIQDIVEYCQLLGIGAGSCRWLDTWSFLANLTKISCRQS